MDLTTNGVVVTDAIKFVQTNKEKLRMSTKEDNSGKESNEPDYDEDKDQSRRKARRGNWRRRNNKSSFLILLTNQKNLLLQSY